MEPSALHDLPEADTAPRGERPEVTRPDGADSESDSMDSLSLSQKDGDWRSSVRVIREPTKIDYRAHRNLLTHEYPVVHTLPGPSSMPSSTDGIVYADDLEFISISPYGTRFIPQPGNTINGISGPYLLAPYRTVKFIPFGVDRWFASAPSVASADGQTPA